MMLDAFIMHVLLCLCSVIPNVLLAPTDSNQFIDECANVQEKREPASEWGTYTRITEDQENDFFDYIFLKIPQGTTSCKMSSDFQLSRHYTSLKDPNKQIFSYYCAQAADRGYEHIMASMEPVKEQFIKWAESLSDFGITGAKGFPDTEYTKEELKEKKKYVEPILDAVREQVPEDLCPYPALETEFYFKEKDENHLHYWKFPLSCGMNYETKIEVEVMQDRENCAVNDGKLTLAYNSETAVGNQRYLEEKAKEEKEEGARVVAGSSCLSASPGTVMMAIFVASVAAILSF